MDTASVLVLSFLAYSFFGWIIEAVVLLGYDHRFRNPGFLTGPFVPIYGIGVMAILAATRPFLDQPGLVFLAGVAIATAVEFVGHLLLEKLLGLVLWDYHGRLGNIGGRVCVGNSAAFGAAGMVVVYGIDPTLAAQLGHLDPTVAVSLASALTALVALDWLHAMVAMVRVRPEIDTIRGTLNELRLNLEQQLDQASAGLQNRVAQQRTHVLQRSRRVVARLEAAFPAARIALRDGHSEPHPPGGATPPPNDQVAPGSMSPASSSNARSLASPQH